MNGPISALSSVTDGVLTVDLESRVVYMNPAAEKMTGWNLKDAAGKSSCDVFRVINAVTREENWDPIRAVLEDGQGYSLLPHSVLVHREGGETPVEDSISPIFSSNSGVLCGAAVVFRDVGYSRLLLLKALHRANHDFLTTLPNRAALTDRLQLALTDLQNPSMGALLYIDVDSFKAINDIFGHNAGDFVLQVLAKRMASSMRTDDLLCRFGGDEFVALVLNLDGPGSIIRIVGALVKCASEPIVFEGRTISTSVSVGIAKWTSGHNKAEAIIASADAAMYAVKKAGGNGGRWFTPDMRSTPRTKIDIEAELQAALEEDRFVLCYQPQVNVLTGKIAGAEALLRLRTLDGELRSPASFLPVAERTGQIVAIGQVVLRTVLQQQQRWRASGFSIRVAMNVSPYELQSPEFQATFERILSLENFQKGSLLLEFTEAGSLHSATHRDMLSNLKANGVDLAVDDFGTGHSNLDYLKRFPIDVVKIDREFLPNAATGCRDSLLVKAIIDMAQGLEKTVIAEGVETQEQLAFLRDSACDQAQGFLFAPGITPLELVSRFALEKSAS